MQISKELLDAIASYLVSRPYQEVIWLISWLQQEISKQEEEKQEQNQKTEKK